MPTKLIWLSLDLTFRINSYLCTMPIGYNPKKKAFSLEQNPRKLLWWYFVVFFLYLFLSVGSAGYVVIRQMTSPKPNLRIIHTFLYALVCVVGVMMVGLAVAVITNGDKAVERVNWIVKYYEELLRMENRGQQTKIWPTADGQLDRIGMLFSLILLGLPLIPAFGVGFGLAVNLDVYQYFLEDIIPKDIYNLLLTRILVKILSGIVAYICFAESVRLIPLLIYFIAVPIQLNIRCIRLLKEMQIQGTLEQRRRKYNLIYQKFTQLQVVNQAESEHHSTYAFALMGFGLILSSSVNFATLRLYDALPLGFYAIFPFAAGGIVIAVQQLLPVTISAHEDSKEALEMWVKQLSKKKEDKFLKKKFWALRSIRFYGGLCGFRFFMFQKSMNTALMELIVDSTI